MPNGSWSYFSPETGERLLQSLGGKRGRFPDLRGTLIPGEQHAVQAVRSIFAWRFRDGWGVRRIARMLNECGAIAPKGGTWQPSTIEAICRNPLYLGMVRLVIYRLPHDMVSWNRIEALETAFVDEAICQEVRTYQDRHCW